MSGPICADSSALANAVMGRLPVLRQELNDVFGQARIVLAPSLIHFEMVNTLWKYVRAGSIDRERCREMLKAFLALPIRLVDDDELHLMASDLANQLLGLSGYDAHFIAVARRTNSELWTVDKRLAAIGETQGIPTRLWSA